MVDLEQFLEKGRSVGFGYGRYFTGQDGRGDGVLVAHEIAHHEAEALFAASDEFFLAFGTADHVGNPLEARQPGFALYSVQVGDLVEDVRGDDGRADELFSVEPALFAPALQEVGDEYGVGLVAVEQFEFSVQIAHRDADAVGVRVGAYHHVGIFPDGQVGGHLQGFGIFRVGGLDGGEIARGDHLFLDGYVVETGAVQCGNHCPERSPVDGGIYQFEVLTSRGVATAMLDGGFDECTVYFRSDRFDKLFIGRKADVAHVHFGHTVDDAGVVRGDYL